MAVGKILAEVDRLAEYDHPERLPELFFIPRDLLQPIADSFEGEREIAGEYTGDSIAYPVTAIYSMYAAWERSGVLPRLGGWMAQPLSVLVQLEAIETTVTAYRMKRNKLMDKLTPLQRALMTWLEN